MKKRKSIKWIVGIIVVLVAVRLALPYVVKWYLNNRILNNLKTYTGHVEDVDLALWRGAYVINGLTIEKKNAEVKEPFINISKIDFSVEWQALFKGRIVSEIYIFSPEVRFALSKDEKKAQTGAEEDWTKVVKKLMPIDINKLVIRDGKLKLLNLFTAFETGISLNDFNLEMRNIQNVVKDKSEVLPTGIDASATVFEEKSLLKFNAKAMLLKKIPDFEYDMSFEKIDLKGMNPLMKHFTGMDFQRGSLSIYSEMAMKDGRYKGYFKPLMKDIRIYNLKEEDRNLLQAAKEVVSEAVQEVFENQKKQQTATKVPIEGQVNKADPDVFRTIVNALINAYIDAFKYRLDQTIKFSDADDISASSDSEGKK